MLLQGLPFGLPDYARIDLTRPLIHQPRDPAVGSPINIGVSGDKIWILNTIYLEFHTDGTAANRVPIIDYFDATVQLVALAPVNGVVAAFGNVFCTWTVNAAAAYFASPYFVTPIAPIVLLPGMIIVVTASAMQAGDRIANVRFTGVEIPTGPEVGSGTFGEPDSFVTYPVGVAA